MDKSSGIPT